ncbi:MAG: four helix bundle protein [Candidatus Thermoplasmatota archaeon]|nr:four helix bundle protein [Euryarchaeota archaeon]MBU4032814.1 four helix bundle protein [Candidatus Thermoplasmatota archaeon]MBU4071539.1 four helix bundle protein [Candidatus Thermoplasmatota archaeon]MBU4144501.1 four helix bundle protein [Candidatus Thermoplasmatota archaeon]MBU4592705.1 four helix bundle protein [Candidatus Thermoplasmatota archaeon]
MNRTELIARTKKFALNSIVLVESFPKSKSADIIGRQLIKSATSVGANYRATCRAQSYSHFISKISIVEEEADETIYWLELAIESGLVPVERIGDLIKEANELTAIFSASKKTARARNEKQ